MAVNPIGNVTYINQNAQVNSIQYANSQVKGDFQAMVNLQIMEEKQNAKATEKVEKKVADKKPTTEGKKETKKQETPKKNTNKKFEKFYIYDIMGKLPYFNFIFFQYLIKS